MTDSRCGTNAGYQAHIRRSELPCSECSTSHRLYLSSRKEIYKGRYRERNNEYRKTRPDANRLAVQRWRKNNLEKYKDNIAKYHNSRRARKYLVESETYTDRLVIQTHGTTCHICSEPIDLDAPRKPGVTGWETGLHLDHVIPLFQGGSDTLDNVKPAHGKCNLKKQRTLITITED